MNELVLSQGLKTMYFEEPAGLSPGNRITAVEMARFSASLLQRWPETVEDLFTLQSFAYPREHHFPNGIIQGESISQANRNLLIGTFPGAEGLKTGYTSAAGYNLAAAARQQDRRLIAVLLGVEGENHQQGGQRRTSDAAELLEWGFREYTFLSFDAPTIEEVPVMGGAVRQTSLGTAGEKDIVLPRMMVPALQGQLDIPSTLWAPLQAGDVVGTLRYLVDDCTVHRVPLVIQEDIPQGSIFRRLWDRLRVMIATLFR
jgi:D-alanyl-D-alanine carboxypeptidase (penicillin-binding protein 5/6)